MQDRGSFHSAWRSEAGRHGGAATQEDSAAQHTRLGRSSAAFSGERLRGGEAVLVNVMPGDQTVLHGEVQRERSADQGTLTTSGGGFQQVRAQPLAVLVAPFLQRV